MTSVVQFSEFVCKKKIDSKLFNPLLPSTVTLDDILSDDEVGPLWNIPLEWSTLLFYPFFFSICLFFSNILAEKLQSRKQFFFHNDIILVYI